MPDSLINSDYLVTHKKDNEQLRKEFSELQKQVRKLEEANITNYT